MNQSTTVKVWDLPVRLFHWSLVAAFTLAYLSEDDLLTLHVVAGYTIAGLVLFRLVWGLIGTRHARFTDFVKPPAEVVSYIRDILAFRARSYVGHNPAGGAMVIALLISLVLTSVSGLAVYGAKEMAGPLAATFSGISPFMAEALEEVHEFFANFTLLLVVLHVAGVLLASFQHKENLVRSMVTGIKQAHNQ
jgi:cytochrome b